MTWPLTPSETKLPRATIFVQASEIADPRGMRAVVGSHTYGWRRDLRCDRPLIRGGKSYVPILTEHDWYRAESERTEVFAPLIPIDRVWISTTGDPADSDRNGPSVANPVRAVQAARICGLRIIYMPQSGTAIEERDLRATSEPHQDATGTVILAALEYEWYQWAWSGKIAQARRINVGDVWVE
jgi:hypothetical protein